MFSNQRASLTTLFGMVRLGSTRAESRRERGGSTPLQRPKGSNTKTILNFQF